MQNLRQVDCCKFCCHCLHTFRAFGQYELGCNVDMSHPGDIIMRDKEYRHNASATRFVANPNDGKDLEQWRADHRVGSHTVCDKFERFH